MMRSWMQYGMVNAQCILLRSGLPADGRGHGQGESSGVVRREDHDNGAAG